MALSPSSTAAGGANGDLKARYQAIANQAIQTPNWPASDDIVRLLEHHPLSHDDDDDDDDDLVGVGGGVCTSTFRAPRFHRDGPLGLVALFSETDNPAAGPLIQRCLDCFDTLVQDLVDITNAASSSPQPPLLHIIPKSKVPHVCVFMVHEHPSFLSSSSSNDDADEKPLVDDATLQLLIQDLSSVIDEHSISNGIWLQLESILLTPDGAMIAGFVEAAAQQQRREDGSTVSAADNNNNSAYQSMKTECVDRARARLGTTLTSRPKNLIHVTLGRVLGFGQHVLQRPSELPEDDERQERVRALVQRYNQEVLPDMVKCIREEQPTAGTWRLQHLSLLRNTVWFCEENIIYKTWDLCGTNNDGDSAG